MKEKILFFLHLIITVASSIMYVITMKQKAAAIREYNSLSQWQRSMMSVNPYNPDYTVYFLTVAIVSFIFCIMLLIIMIKEKKDKKNRSAE